MPIRLICVCQRVMTVPDRYAGERVQCPDCGAMLGNPTPDEDKALARWLCGCGQRLKARAKSAGRKVTCPRCGKGVTVPLQEVSPGAEGRRIEPLAIPPTEAPGFDAVLPHLAQDHPAG